VTQERRGRFLSRAASMDPAVVTGSAVDAKRLAAWWGRFVAEQPDLHDALVRATGIPGQWPDPAP
jgi:hypothetical protein